MRKSVDASGDGRERNGPQVVLFHQLQAVQVGILEHLLKWCNRNIWKYIHFSNLSIMFYLWMFSHWSDRGDDVPCRKFVATTDLGLSIFTPGMIRYDVLWCDVNVNKETCKQATNENRQSLHTKTVCPRCEVMWCVVIIMIIMLMKMMVIRVSQKNQKSEFCFATKPTGFHRLDEPPEKISAL